jgi:hypothetical protein
MDNLKKLCKKGACVLMTVAVVGTLSGCIERELATNTNVSYDVIDTMDTEALKNGLQQIIEVPGENFKLVVDYKCELQEGERWIVTSDKKINMEVRTDGVDDTTTKVYIDNIHTDTTICSRFPTVDGITQDSMDDRIHNSLMLGFPIADDVSYVGINEIEGQNQTFISGAYMGFNGYSSGSVTERRYKESEYLDKGVYANKITSIIDLIIVKGDQKRTVSVPSEVQVSVWPFIQVINEEGNLVYRYYTYDDKEGDMVYTDLSEDEYLVKTQLPSQDKAKTKTAN